MIVALLREENDNGSLRPNYWRVRCIQGWPPDCLRFQPGLHTSQVVLHYAWTSQLKWTHYITVKLNYVKLQYIMLFWYFSGAFLVTAIQHQVGCAMGCVFCATGQMGFKRHLTSSEIFEQVDQWWIRSHDTMWWWVKMTWGPQSLVYSNKHLVLGYLILTTHI